MTTTDTAPSTGYPQPVDGLLPDLLKDFDPTEARDEHGRWTKIGAARHALAQAAGADVIGHKVFGGEEGHSDSHGIIAAHPGGDYSLALHDRDVGTHYVMSIPDDDAREELANALDILDPNVAETIEAEDGSWRVESTPEGVTLYANLDNDEATEEVLLSHDDAETLVNALSGVHGMADASADDPSFTLPLGQFETLEGARKRFSATDAQFTAVGAVVSTPEGERFRLGAIEEGDSGIKDWTGGRGPTTVDLDREQAAHIADILERFEAAQKVRQKSFDEYIGNAQKAEEEGEDVDYNIVSENIVHAIGGDFEDDFEQLLVPTSWGTVRLTDVGMNDPENAFERHTRLEIWPAGMSEAEYDAGQEPDGGPDWGWPSTGNESRYEKPHPDIPPAKMRALARALRSYAEGSSLSKAAGHGGSSWEHQWKYGKLRKKWIGHPHPVTELHRHLSHHMPSEMAWRTANQWYKDLFGIWPAERKGKNPVGRG